MGEAWAETLLGIAAAFPALLVVLVVLGYARKLWLMRRAAGSVPQEANRREAAVKRSEKMASVWRCTMPMRAFRWSENPSHVVTAVEHGWAAFSFSYNTSVVGSFAGPVQQMWDLCTKCASMEFLEPEVTWTVGGGGDFMQQIRLNPGVRPNKDGCVLPVQALQSALPLPGPLLGPCPYPQGAYFEVTIVAARNDHSSGHSSLAGSEHMKLIGKGLPSDRFVRPQTFTDFGSDGLGGKLDIESQGKADPTSLPRTVSNGDEVGEKQVQLGEGGAPDVVEGVSLFDRADQIDWDELLSVGLAGSDAPPFRLPGFDPGSVGFLSADGHCYVDGAPHLDAGQNVLLSSRSWGAVKSTVGCGFDPRVKKVYFTLNGELVHEATLGSADFSNPLYPTIASNYDVTILVNLGQSAFEFVPANSGRVANPSCRLLPSRSTKNGLYDDSGDLFSMGRIDSQWLTELEFINSQELQHRHVLSEAESDLFEIVLDGHTVKR